MSAAFVRMWQSFCRNVRLLPARNMALRKQTSQEYQERINQVLHAIHANLSGDLGVKVLARIACYSPFHFQRIFRQVTGESVHDYISRSRLEWAANLLIFNPEASIMAVAAECGFHSNASFSHAFKARFECAPMIWRQEGYEQRIEGLKTLWAESGDNPYPLYYKKTLAGDEDTPLPDIHMERLEDIRVAYLRHRGYDRNIGAVWDRLLTWAADQGVDAGAEQMIGLYHSNPDLIPYDQCRYVACLTLPETIYRTRGVGVMSIPGGLYATCDAEGAFGELLYLMHNLYHKWLPESDYEARNIPPHALYLENHFINRSGRYRVHFRIPVKLK